MQQPSRTFTAGGHTWTVDVNLVTARKVKDLLGVDLPGLLTNHAAGLAGLLGDPGRFVDVLYVLVKDQADKLGVTDEDFGRSLVGDGIGQAGEAFLDAMVAWIPGADARRLFQTALAKARDIGNRAAALAAARDAIEQIDVEDMAQRLVAAPPPN